jgi:hypothetical protein
MDAVFENAPTIVVGTQYARVPPRDLAERELREGTFVPGGLTEDVAMAPGSLKARDFETGSSIVGEKKGSLAAAEHLEAVSENVLEKR